MDSLSIIVEFHRFKSCDHNIFSLFFEVLNQFQFRVCQKTPLEPELYAKLTYWWASNFEKSMLSWRQFLLLDKRVYILAEMSKVM